MTEKPWRWLDFTVKHVGPHVLLRVGGGFMQVCVEQRPGLWSWIVTREGGLRSAGGAVTSARQAKDRCAAAARRLRRDSASR